MNGAVQITFECLPLRAVGRLDVPLDASEEFLTIARRIQQAIAKHGCHNSYFLHDAHCTFQLTNDPQVGLLEFAFEGTLLTDVNDRRTQHADLTVRLDAESCDWLTATVTDWFAATVRRAVAVDFDRFITSGDLARTVARLEQVERESDAAGGYLGMYL